MLILAALALIAADPAAPAATPAATSVSPDGFKIGVDTAETIKAKLGKPNMVEANSDGTTTIRYVSVHTKIKGSTFIPVVGLFAGGAKGKSTTRSFTFNADGTLKNFASGDFETNCGMMGNCH